MRKYFTLSLLPLTGLLGSCGGREYYGPGGPGPGPGGWWPMMHYGFGYGGIFMWFIFLAVLGLLVYFIAQSQRTKGPTSSRPESPMDVLKKRYAGGEITKEEFDRIKKDLEG
jgi:putative membrane protein